MESCIYEGQVRHTRTSPVLHAFRYRVFMMYLDLDELPSLFNGRWFWSARRAAPARFHRGNYLGPEEQSLADSIRDRVLSETGHRPEGPVRILTNLSYFGFCFNPVSFFYCFASDGRTVEYIVAEVNNTPWGERETYVLPAAESIGTNDVMRFQPDKKMHVSPFMPMKIDYDWTFHVPQKRLSVFMANLENEKRIFTASIQLRRAEITGASLARVLMTFPFMTMKVIGAIYWQALRLWLKRCPFYPHPNSKDTMVVQ